jgi:hypothetical protein
MCELCYLVLQFHHSTDLILLFFSVCQNLNTDTSSYIAENQKRKEVSDLLNGEIVKLNNITHTYDGFTKSVREYQEYIIVKGL